MLHIGTFVVEAIIIRHARLYARGMLELYLEALAVQFRPVGLIECGSLEWRIAECGVEGQTDGMQAAVLYYCQVVDGNLGPEAVVFV